jgi:hypothetical protein
MEDRLIARYVSAQVSATTKEKRTGTVSGFEYLNSPSEPCPPMWIVNELNYKA